MGAMRTESDFSRRVLPLSLLSPLSIKRLSTYSSIRFSKGSRPRPRIWHGVTNPPHVLVRLTCCLDTLAVQRQNHGVDIVEKLKRDDDQSAPKTLGDILYADAARTWVEESAWVVLVRSIANEDQDALRSLYERTHRIVFTLAMRITNSQETAEEVTIDVFHDVWRRASEYDPAGGSVVGWIMNQARSRSIDRLRFETRKKRSADYSQSPAEPASPDPQQTYQLEEQNRLLRKALEVLSADERKAIETAFFSELSYQEVAVKLNQAPGTIKTRIRSGLAKLRETLSGTLKDL